ncbi:MAG: peptidase M23 [Parcubacteria group bacterium Athens0714_24]|nr:MAG: peptidase M23 [Parcubacteria group bacterium Athens0714_24]
MRNEIKKILIFAAILLVTYYALRVTPTFSATIDELQAQIGEKNKQIDSIQAEINKLQEQINQNSSLANTLKNQISQLNLQKQKLQKDISLTQKKIDTAKLNIQELGLQILQKEQDIQKKLLVISEAIKNINDTDKTSVVEIVLAQQNFSDFFNDIDKMDNFQKEINANLAELKDLKISLEDEKQSQEKEKKNLEQYKSKLSDQNKLVDINKKSKNQLLTETKNQQTNYQKQMAQMIKLRDELEKEIGDIEAKIQIQINPNSIPRAGSGVLAWPFTDEKMLACKKFTDLKNIFCITQYFGNTPFATANPQLYKTGEHKGLDFRAPVGTEILAAGSGKIVGLGDTDITCPSASYGKWIMIDHGNGLSTVYGHLSYIKVAKGQIVARGDLIGYSGNTGASTGPHLHFEVRATAGTQVSQRESTVCKGRIYTIPLGSISSYLNPLSYL